MPSPACRAARGEGGSRIGRRHALLGVVPLLVVACGGSSPAPGGVCSTVGEQSGMQNGTLVCTESASGRTWQPMSNQGPPPSAAASTGSSPAPAGGAAASARVGDVCARDRAFGFGDGMITVCSGGCYRYALPEDLPPAPAGGYAKRPEWYPTLGQIFGPKVDECTGGPVRFSQPVIEPAKVTRSMPAGMMIYDHVTPIDHLYIGITALDRPASERAADAATIRVPAAGTVIEVSSLGSPTSHRVTVAHGCGIVSVYMVVNRLTGVLAPYAEQVGTKGAVAVSLPVRAGDEIGTQTDNPLDFNIFDGATWLPRFANPFSYAAGEAWKPYTADPFPLFTNGAGDALRAGVQRVVEPRWGVIDRDVPGTAAGSWFIDGTIGYTGLPVEVVRAATSQLPGNAVPGKSTYAWGHLTLAPHPVDEQTWIFSTGWWNDPTGDPKQVMIDRSGGLPAPDQLKPANGAVVYPLAAFSVKQPAGFSRTQQSSPDGIGYTLTAGAAVGFAVVQVNDNGTLAVEVSTDPARRPAGFTAAKRSYHR